MQSLEKYLFTVTHGQDTLQFEGIFLETIGKHHLVADYVTQKFKILQEGEFKVSTPEEKDQDKTQEPHGFEEYNFKEHADVMTQVTVKALDLMNITGVNLSLEDYLGVMEGKINEQTNPNAQVFLRLFHDKIALNPFIHSMLDEYPDSSIRQISDQLEQDPREEAKKHLENMDAYLHLHKGLTQLLAVLH